MLYRCTKKNKLKWCKQPYIQTPSQPDKTARGNLFILVSFPSGAGKSETFRPVVEPFFAYERDMVEHWQADVLPGIEADMDLLKMEVESLHKKFCKG